MFTEGGDSVEKGNPVGGNLVVIEGQERGVTRVLS